MIGGTIVDDFFGISFVYFFGISCQFFCVHYLNEWWSARGQHIVEFPMVVFECWRYFDKVWWCSAI